MPDVLADDGPDVIRQMSAAVTCVDTRYGHWVPPLCTPEYLSWKYEVLVVAFSGAWAVAA